MIKPKSGSVEFRLQRFRLVFSSWISAILSILVLLIIVIAFAFAIVSFTTPTNIRYECPENERFSRDCLLAITQDLYLDTAEMESCLSDNSYDDVIEGFQAQAVSLGVDDLPSVYFGTGDSELTGFLVPGGLTTAQMSSIANGGYASIEDLQRDVLLSLSEEIDELERTLLEFYSSEAGGALSLADATQKVKDLTEDERDRIKQTAFLREYELTQGPYVGSGEITVIVFSNYECARCREAMQDQISILEYGARNGGFRYVFRDVVSEEYRYSNTLARAAHCAGEQGRFFGFHARLFTQ